MPLIDEMCTRARRRSVDNGGKEVMYYSEKPDTRQFSISRARFMLATATSSL